MQSHPKSLLPGRGPRSKDGAREGHFLPVFPQNRTAGCGVTSPPERPGALCQEGRAALRMGCPGGAGPSGSPSSREVYLQPWRKGGLQPGWRRILQEIASRNRHSGFLSLQRERCFCKHLGCSPSGLGGRLREGRGRTAASRPQWDSWRLQTPKTWTKAAATTGTRTI